jgi:TFIIF-interacting CTD phosphatase-like protein
MIFNRHEKLNIVFDLDDTLICTKHKYMGLYIDSEPYTTIKIENYEFIVFRRPFAYHILKLLSKFNDIHLFTAAKQEYADLVIDSCFGDIIFKQKLYRQHCLLTDFANIKDLNLITGTRKILIDDMRGNHITGQNSFYHIPKYKVHNGYDMEMIKLFFYVVWKSLFYHIFFH